MIVPFIAALLIAMLNPTVRVVDERGAPIAGATVVFRSVTGVLASVTTDTKGRADGPAGLDATAVRIAAPGYEPVDTALSGAAIVLHPPTTVIGRVAVATGSARSLHRLAVPAAALDRTAIATTPAYATDALLRSLPGFDQVRSNSAFTNYGNLRVSFSGAGQDRGLVLADDVPAQDGFGGQVNWLAYPPSSLAAVELLRGPGAALYGANAVGGVLELRSAGPNADSAALPDGRFDVQDGTPHRTSADLTYRFVLAPHLTAAVTTQTGHQAYYDLTPGYQTPLDREATATSTATRAQVRYGFGNSSLSVGELSTNDAQFEGRPNYTFARNSNQGDLHFTTTSGDSTVGLVAYDRDTDITNTNDQAPAKPGLLRYVQKIPTRESGVAATWFLTQTYNEVALRADERFVFGDSKQRGPTGVLQSAGTGKQQYAGIALEDTYERGRFQLIGGLRGDLVTFFGASTTSGGAPTAVPSRDDRVISPRVAGRYNISRTLALRASTGGGFREPFLNELLRGYRIGNVSYNSNSKLTPERSAYYGLGADVLLGSGRVALDFGQTTVKNAIAFLTTSATTQTRSNVGQTQTDSTTLTYTAPIARCTRLRAYATTQYARVTRGPANIIANRIQYVPARSGDIALDSGSGALEYGADVGYAGVTFADDRNTQVLPAAVIVSAHLTRPLGEGAALTLEGANLTGTRYLSSIDRYGPPPSVNLRVRFGLGPQAPGATPGCPQR